MANSSNKKSLAKQYLAERDRIIYQMRTTGLSHHAIAERLDITTKQVSAALQRQLTRLNKENQLSYPEVLRMELERLDRLQSAFWPMAQRRTINVEGEEITMDPDARAADMILKILNHRANLLGLNIQRIQQEVSTHQEIRHTLAGESGPAAISGTDPKEETRQLLQLMGESRILPKAEIDHILARLDANEIIEDIEIVEEVDKAFPQPIDSESNEQTPQEEE